MNNVFAVKILQSIGHLSDILLANDLNQRVSFIMEKIPSSIYAHGYFVSPRNTHVWQVACTILHWQRTPTSRKSVSRHGRNHIAAIRLDAAYFSESRFRNGSSSLRDLRQAQIYTDI